MSNKKPIEDGELINFLKNTLIEGIVPDIEKTKGWTIDTSTGTPILMYNNCSVIESEQAHLVLTALQKQSEYNEHVSILQEKVRSLKSEFSELHLVRRDQEKELERLRRITDVCNITSP